MDSIQDVLLWRKPAYRLKKGEPALSDPDRIPGNKQSIQVISNEILRHLQTKSLGKSVPLSETNPKNSSILDWIVEALELYPSYNNKIIDYLMNAFRASLYPRSKERDRFILVVMQMKNTLVIAHTRSDLSIGGVSQSSKKKQSTAPKNDYSLITPVRRLLDPENVRRAISIIREKNDVLVWAFEKSRSLSRGLAEFLGISAENVGWEDTGNIRMTINVDGFDWPLRIDMEREQLDDMVSAKVIKRTGAFMIGRASATIGQVQAFGRTYEYPDFWNSYVDETEKLVKYRKAFNGFIPEEIQLETIIGNNLTFKYEEDINAVSQIGVDGPSIKITKDHPRFKIAFFTLKPPRIKPQETFLETIYQSVFENKPLELWHAGEKSSDESISIGSLAVFNDVGFTSDIENYVKKVLGHIHDNTVKQKLLLQYHMCQMCESWLSSTHFHSLFWFLKQKIQKLVDDEFEKPIMSGKEGYIEYKNIDAVIGKPSDFAINILLEHVLKCKKKSKLEKYVIIYGMDEASQTLRPINSWKSEQYTAIEEITNNALEKEDLQIKILPVSHSGGYIPIVFVITRSPFQPMAS
jgi:hypothetical protein